MARLITKWIFLAFLSFPVAAQDKTVTYLFDAGAAPAERIIDIRHLTAALVIDPYDTLVTGSVLFDFSPVLSDFDSVVFWSPDIEFQVVEIDGVDIEYYKSGDNLVIKNLSGMPLNPQKEYKLSMIYSSRPKYDLFFIGWNEPAIRPNKMIWAHRPFHWLPFYHDRLTVDMHITFDAGYQVFSNGVRVSETRNQGGTKTWHYKMYREHPFFSTALVIGDYRYLESQTADGIPLELWYYSWQKDHAEPTYRYTADMFAFFNEEFGFSYPYEQYREAPVEDYLYGAMETTTSTVFGDYLAVDERGFDLRNYVNVNAHELAHQWYGNCLSHLSGSDVWLTESFATYYAKMFEKEVFGEDYYQNVRRLEFEEALAASRNDGFPVGHSRGGRARWYPKGSLVLDMMRDVLGEEGFKAAMKEYTTRNAFSEVETAEFLAAIYEATGQSLAWFFDQWIYRGGEPAYDVSWHPGKSGEGTDVAVVEVKQVHQRNELTGLFKMPVNIDVYYDDGSNSRVTRWISDEYERVEIPVQSGKTMAFILFDPGSRILKTVTFEKTLVEWSGQALMAGEMTDRYDALAALRDYPVSDKKDVLLKAWEKETFQLTRGEILRQLFSDYQPEFNPVIIGALMDEDPLVRRAALEYVDVIPSGLQGHYERLLTDRSYANVEKALTALSRSFPEKIPLYLETTKNETGWRGLNIRMKWLEIAIGAGQREYLAELVEYAGPRYEFETRMNAFHLLKRLNYLDIAAAGYLLDGYLYWNYKVSNAARETIQYFSQQNRHKETISRALESGRFSAGDRKRLDQLLSETLK